MQLSTHIVVLCTTGMIFAGLLASGARRRKRNAIVSTNRTSEIAIAGLASINLAGVIGLAWFAANMLFYDGFMVVELAICAGLIAILAAITAGAFALARHGRTGTAIAVLAIGALPTIAAFGFLLYLDSNPIDWR